MTSHRYPWPALRADYVRTAGRQLSRFESGEEALARTGPSLAGRRTIAWSELSDLRLRFYSTRRDRARGWMQLKLRSPGGRLSVDSTLDGFDAIARRAAAAAVRNRLALGSATLANLAALGIAVETEDGRALGFAASPQGESR